MVYYPLDIESMLCFTSNSLRPHHLLVGVQYHGKKALAYQFILFHAFLSFQKKAKEGCVDDCTIHVERVSYARILVEIDVTKSLSSIFKICDTVGKIVKQLVLYD